MTKFCIIVSTENNPYMAWQCKLFHFSCVTHLDMTPVFFVHDWSEPLNKGFSEILQAGGQVYRAPSYALTGGTYIYKPRNTAGTLLHAAEELEKNYDYLILCDPDMIFLRRLRLNEELSGSFYSYMNYQYELVQEAAQKCGVSLGNLLNRDELRCGVPYIIPMQGAWELARTWLYAMDQFAEGMWESIMYAFGIAATKLEMPLRLNNFVGNEYRMQQSPDGDVIHYCYSLDDWDKRKYVTEEDSRRVWEAQGQARAGSIMAEILKQLGEAHRFYSPVVI